MNGKNIHTILKDFLKQKRSKKKGKSNFFLFFALFFLTAFTVITTLESSWSDNEHKESLEESDLFVSCNESDSDNKNSLVFSNNNSVVAYSTPYFIETEVLGSVKKERSSIISYKVEEGDSVESIADMFGISSDTVKWANSIKNNKINPGDELLILPTTGVLYYVERNDSLGVIAQKHKAKVEDIMSFNQIEDEKTIKPGDSLIIPDGQPAPTPVIQQSKTVYSTGFSSVTHGVITQVPHAKHQNAVDIANSCGTPIYAGYSGVITKTGSDPALAGNYVWIDHGTVSALYGHLQAIYVVPGERVVAGQQIGTMGNTGYTIGATGCHLHFETRGGQNPFYYLQRGERM